MFIQVTGRRLLFIFLGPRRKGCEKGQHLKTIWKKVPRQRIRPVIFDIRSHHKRCHSSHSISKYQQCSYPEFFITSSNLIHSIIKKIPWSMLLNSKFVSEFICWQWSNYRSIGQSWNCFKALRTFKLPPADAFDDSACDWHGSHQVAPAGAT